ncbi:uncharacterized protein LOC142492266 [Ascaphus truei]|uniref:uncharacterized protein LOC142492266 n=1 Tax=Ascaphus truei TaxID=8439 RepID=UPI003F5A2A35
MDFLCIEADSKGIGKVLVVTDHCTRYAQTFPIKDQKALTVAKVLWEKYFIHYGLPNRMHSDQGRDLSRSFSTCSTSRSLGPLHISKGRCSAGEVQLNPALHAGTLKGSQKAKWSKNVESLVHAYNYTRQRRKALPDKSNLQAVSVHLRAHQVYAKNRHKRLHFAPEGHVSPETEQVSSPGSASSTHLEEHDDEDYDDDDDDDDDDAAIDTQIQASDHEEVPIETVLPPNRPANTTYDAIVASEGKIVEAENRRHSDLMTVLERMIALQEETVSQFAHLHRVFIEVPKQLQKINTSFEALVVQQTQANYLRMTNVPQFNLNTSQAGSVHAGQFSPHASDLHSPGPNVTGQVADIAVQVPDDMLPLPSVQNQQLTPTKEATQTKHKQLLLTSFWSKTKKDTHETEQPSLVQCLPTCSHVSVGTSPVGESLATSPVREQSLPTSPVSESLPKSPVGEQSLPKSPVGEQSLPKSPVGESLPKSPVGESLATSPAREVPEASQSGSVVAKVVGKRKRKIQETTSRPVTRSQKEPKK